MAPQPLPSGKTVREALKYLATHHNTLAAYSDVEALAVEGEVNLPPNTYKGLMFHLLAIRRELSRVLWRDEIFVGASLIDEVVFQQVKTDPSNAYDNTHALLLRRGADRSGFVLYPLHGFGLSESPFPWGPQSPNLICFPKLGVGFSAQAHSIDAAYRSLSHIARRLGVSGRVPHDIFCRSHYGWMKWITENPVMVVKIASHTGAYYENQFVYALKIRIAAAFTAMLHALASDRAGREPDGYSTALVNNFETLDIRHYLIAEAPWHNSPDLELRRVPMNLSPIDLAKLSDLTITLDSAALRLPFVRAMTRELLRAAGRVQLGHLTHVNGDSGDKLHRRIYARIVTALDWFRQSFGSRSTKDEAIVALAIAFETLLTDYYALGVAERVVRRVRICLRRRHGVSGYADAVRSVMASRGAIVHTGSTLANANRLKAQAAFALCFQALVAKLPLLGTSPDQPIGELLAD